MSESVNSQKEITPSRFLLYIGLGLVALVLLLFALGATLTHFLWPVQDNLSHPVMYKENSNESSRPGNQ